MSRLRARAGCGLEAVEDNDDGRETVGVYDEDVDYERARSPERAWEYEWAINQAAGVSDELADFSSEAEAAMTLADAEIEKCIALMREKVADARTESARLRLELEDARKALDEQREAQELYDQMDMDVRRERNEARNRVCELRTKNNHLRSSLKHSLRDAEFYAQETRKHLAVIERVRALHHKVGDVRSPECGYCFEGWPCTTEELAQAVLGEESNV